MLVPVSLLSPPPPPPPHPPPRGTELGLAHHDIKGRLDSCALMTAPNAFCGLFMYAASSVPPAPSPPLPCALSPPLYSTQFNVPAECSWHQHSWQQSNAIAECQRPTFVIIAPDARLLIESLPAAPQKLQLQKDFLRMHLPLTALIAGRALLCHASLSQMARVHISPRVSVSFQPVSSLTPGL